MLIVLLCFIWHDHGCHEVGPETILINLYKLCSLGFQMLVKLSLLVLLDVVFRYLTISKIFIYVDQVTEY